MSIRVTRVLGDQTVLARNLADTARTGGWAPTNAIAQTLPRSPLTGTNLLVTGTLYLSGGCLIPGGRQVNTISFITSGAGAGANMTHQWFCLVDQSLNVLAKTTDDTNTAWGNATVKTLTISGGYTPTNATAVYLGVLVTNTSGAMPTLVRPAGASASGALGIAPSMGGASTVSLTDPASLGSTVTAPSNNDPLYGYIS